ncbi:MAG: ABC transporter ATP-binding protein [Sulfolobales archaeon]
MILETRNLTKRFGGLIAVNRVNLTVNKGDFLLIVGPNGAGKTTLFNLITGYLPPSEGEVYFKGINITNMPPHKIVRLGISRTFQITNIFPSLTVFDNVALSVQRHLIKGFSTFFPNNSLERRIKEKTISILEELRLHEMCDVYTIAGKLPHGIKKYVEIAMALASDPEVLLLDEPLGGLPTEEALELLNFIENFLKRKYTIIMIEHKLSLVKKIAEKIAVMHLGQIIAYGDYNEIIKSPVVKKTYLGKSEET